MEAVFSGRPAAVDSMLEKCKIGPGRARVVNMEVEVCDQPRGVGFKQLADYKYGKQSPVNMAPTFIFSANILMPIE